MSTIKWVEVTKKKTSWEKKSCAAFWVWTNETNYYRTSERQMNQQFYRQNKWIWVKRLSSYSQTTLSIRIIYFVFISIYDFNCVNQFNMSTDSFWFSVAPSPHANVFVICVIVRAHPTGMHFTNMMANETNTKWGRENAILILGTVEATPMKVKLMAARQNIHIFGGASRFRCKLCF